MLGIFRKIRQGMLFGMSKPNKENKVVRYLFYAIGEIILVAIGILIALAVNNSNQNIKDRELERDYLTSLYFEMIKDSIAFEKTEIELEKVEEAGRYIYDTYENYRTSELDSLIFLTKVRFMINFDQKLPEPIVWEELKNTGNLRLIKNRGLIDLLYQYYVSVRSCQSDYDNNAKLHILEGRNFDSRVFSIEDQDDYFDNWKKDEISKPDVFDNFFNNDEFYILTKRIITGMIISRKVLSGLRNKVHEPLSILRNELSIN